MSLLGKILAFLNIIAAGAFLSLAAMDWGKRQAWSHAVLRHEMVLYGLPVDDADQAPAGVPADLHAANLGETLLKETFKGEGVYVRTQLEEVKRKMAEVGNDLESKDEATRRKDVGAMLMTLARTGSERAATAQRLADKGIDTKVLVEDLNKRFNEVIHPNRIEPNATQPRDIEERRRAIAGLLYALSPDPKWHERVRIVVGLNAYGREADRQAQALDTMISQERILLADDRTNFEVQYSKLVQRLHGLDHDVRYLNGIIADLVAQKQKQDVLVKTRMTDLSELQVVLADLQKEYEAVLAEQRKLQKLVFQAQQDLATAADDNLKLERKIRYLELGR